jgi:hypothetical protein
MRRRRASGPVAAASVAEAPEAVVRLDAAVAAQ